MGQKTHPRLLRLGAYIPSSANWYASPNDFKAWLHSDVVLREHIQSHYGSAGISEVIIERQAQMAHVKIRCSRPGVIIGRKGADVETLRRAVSNLLNMRSQVTVEEVKKPDLDAKLVAENVASQLERRQQFRKAMKRAVQSVMRAGAKGIRVEVAGRLGGAEIARTEKYHEGRVPLHTFKSRIDYNTATAYTTYGVIGVKVWICKGEYKSTRSKERQREDS